MGLLSPLALVALPLLGAIVVLYLLRMRRPSAPIASLELWDESLRDREANALWQRLHLSVLLVLQLLILLALIFAIARPWVRDHAPAAKNLVVIIDTSASMAASDADARRTTRIDAARNKALQLIDDLQGGQLASIISANSHASVLVSGTDDKSKLRSVLASLTAQPVAPTDLVSALKLANAIASKQGESLVWVLSDGRFSPTREQVGTLAAGLQYFQVGRGADNQAITALSLDDTDGTLRLFVQVMNADIFPVTRRVDFVVDDVPWDSRNLNIAPGATQEVILDNVPLGARVIAAGFSAPDSLPIDDHAWTVNRSAVPATVLLVSNGNTFLESALSLLPNVSLYKVAPVEYNPEDVIEGSPPDLVIFDAGASVLSADAIRTSSMLLIAPSLTGPLIQSTLVITGPTGITSAASNGTTQSDENAEAKTASLMKFVDLSQAHIQRSGLLSVPPWGHAVLESEEGALIVAGEVGGRRVAAVGFDFRDTDLPLQPAFPLLIRNLVTYLLPAVQGGVPVNVVPGEAVQITPASEAVDFVLVEDPAGVEWTYDVSTPTERIDFSETRAPGVYYITEYSAGEVAAQEAFAVNLFSRDESSIAPVSAPSLPLSKTAAADASTSERPREVWSLLAFAGFLLLITEWLYAQRIVIRRAITEMRTRRALRRLERT